MAEPSSHAPRLRTSSRFKTIAPHIHAKGPLITSPKLPTRSSDPVLRDGCDIESHLDGAVSTRAVDGDDIYNAADDNARPAVPRTSRWPRRAAGRGPRSIAFL